MHTLTSSHWLHRAEPYQYGKPFKDPIKNYQKYLQQKELTQWKEQATKYSYIDKWINNNETDLENSNDFWNNKLTTVSQITQLLKFWINQYMGKARKHTFYPTLHPNNNSLEENHPSKVKQLCKIVLIIMSFNAHFIEMCIKWRYNSHNLTQ
jgi:hypothetical protein